MADSGGGAWGATPLLFLDLTEARRAEKFLGGDQAPPLSKGRDDPPPIHLITRSGSGTDFKVRKNSALCLN